MWSCDRAVSNKMVSHFRRLLRGQWLNSTRKKVLSSLALPTFPASESLASRWRTEANLDSKAKAKDGKEPGWSLRTQWSHCQLQTIHSGWFWLEKNFHHHYFGLLFDVVKLRLTVTTFTNIIPCFSVPLTAHCYFGFAWELRESLLPSVWMNEFLDL